MNSKQDSVLNELNTMRRQMGLPTLNENELLHLELNQIDLNPLNEGWWENAKYSLSKLGKYKSGGKIWGKTQTQAKALAQIEALLKKQANQEIKILDAAIKEKNPEFPNNKSQLDFVNTVIEIATVYDSLVAATKLKPDTKGYLPVDAANAIIEDLRAYTQKYLDVDLTAAFSIFNEEEETQKSIDEASSSAQQAAIAISKKGINEANTKLDLAAAQAADKFADTKAAIKKGDVQAYDTERMKTLNSNKLPALLAISGGVLKGLSWMFQTDWFKNLVDPEQIKQIKTPQQITELIDGGKPDSQGMLHWMGEVSGRKMSTGADVNWFIEKFGGEKGLEGMFINNGAKDAAGNILSPAKQAEMVHELCTQNSSTGVGDIFTKIAKTYGSMKPGLALFGISAQAVFLGKAIYTTYVVTNVAVRTGSYAKWGFAAKVLGPIGIALGAGALAVKIARWKGRKSSRAQVLNDLIQFLRPTEGTKENPPVIGDTGGGEKNPKGGEQDPNKQGKSGADQQLYINLKKYFQDLFNFKGQVNTSTYGQGGSSNPTKQYTAGNQKVTQKITEPNDINGLLKLLEEDNKFLELLEGLNRLIEADDSLGRSINAKGQAANAANSNDKGLGDAGLSSNEVKLFKTNANRLSGIIKAMNKFSSGDKNLNNLISQAKSNPISSIDINQLLVSDDKSLKIFVSNFNKALYSIQFKNGNSIMDQLKLININKLSEAAERMPSKGDINKIYNLRKDFLKNLPNYVKSMYAVFSYLIDQSKKGTLGQSSVKSNTGNKTSTLQTLGATPPPAGKGGTPPPPPNTSATSGAGNTSTEPATGNKDPKKDDYTGTFYPINEDVQLMDLIETHNNLMDIILENMDMLKEFGENQPEMKQGMEDATSNSDSGRIFTQLSIVVPEMSGKIANAYKQQYGQQINRVKLANFLQTVLGSFAKVPQQKMQQLINRGGGDVTDYRRMLRDIKNMEGDAEAGAADAGTEQPGLQYNPSNPEKFLPNKVGNYDLSEINQTFRIGLAKQAAGIISKKGKEQSSENMLEVMKQLIDDINKNGQKGTIPTV